MSPPMAQFSAGLCFIVSPPAKMACQGRARDAQKLRRSPLITVILLVDILNVALHRTGQGQVYAGIVRQVIVIVP